MQKEDLALPLQFTIDCVANDPLIIGGDHRLHGQSVERRGLNRGHVFYAYKRKVERARNRRGGERQDVDKFEELFEFFFMENAEALLLVDDDEAEIFKKDIAGDEPVCANDDIDAAFA